ncbi:hypothetical protein GCM10027186_30890 [Micromonospora schwarzwaldensis]
MEPDRGERLGEDDQQFEGDTDARQQLVRHQMGEGRAGVTRVEDHGADREEPQGAGDGEPEVEQPGRPGGADQRVHGGLLWGG